MTPLYASINFILTQQLSSRKLNFSTPLIPLFVVIQWTFLNLPQQQAPNRENP